MKFKFATITCPNGEDRITFSREEILAMINSIKKDEESYLAPVKRFLDKMEEELLQHSI